MNVAIIFGGSGYIGSFLIKKALEEQKFESIIVYDLKQPEWIKKASLKTSITFIEGDVRNVINIENLNFDPNRSWIFNFAAVHREPGHEYHEYFDTNIAGAENINNFARRTGIKNLFFTSSIAPYGRSLFERTESSSLYPETAYGISKLVAERIHKEWLAEDLERRLVIVRPSVIYGPGDPGNVYRMIQSLKKGTFILPDGGKVIKAYGYVFGLVESMLFAMNKNERLITYNYAENPVVPLNEMVRIVKEELDIKKPVLKLPVPFLLVIASLLQVVFRVIGRKSDIHPVRVKKAGFPTNIKPQYLIDNNFDFKYEFRKSLKHWKNEQPSDFM